MLTTNLLSQGYQKTKLVATLMKFYGRQHDLANSYNVSYCKPLGRYLCWWMIRSSPRISSAQYQFLSADVDTAVLRSVLKY